MHNPASVYASAEHFDAEMRVLFEGMPQLAGLSCDVREPGSYLTITLGRVPVAVVRQDDGSLRAFVNACRHRGSVLLREGLGEGLRKIQCPYHAWTYGLDGCLKAFPGAGAGFDDVDKSTHGLRQRRSIHRRLGPCAVRKRNLPTSTSATTPVSRPVCVSRRSTGSS